uniref:Fibronectin type-III domain-containing protein n=1 Tax=Geobacter metallireducens TaxID=28232 RepID=A0A831UBJ9_GEOME
MKSVTRMVNFWLGLFLLLACTALAQESFAWVIQGAVYGGSNPLAGATVTAYDASSSSPVGSSVTDAGGNYSIAAANGTYNVQVMPPLVSGFANSMVNGVSVNDDNVTQNVVLVQEANVLSGVVQGLNGTPASNIVLGIKDQPSGTLVATLITDAYGQYAIPLASGTYEIGAQYSGLASSVPTPKAYWIWPLVRNLQVSGATTRDLSLPFVTLSGHTTDSNGVPVPGVQVKVDQYWSDTSSGGYTFKKIITDVVSDASGAYSLTLIAGGTYSIALSPAAGSNFANTVLTNVTVNADMHKNLVVSSKHILSGVVRSLNGTPASNVVLGIKDQTSGTGIAVLITNMNGQYSVPLASGAYEIEVQYSGLASSVPTPKAYWILPMVRNLQVSGTTTRDLVLPFVTLSGHTTDSNGVPVPGVQVKVDQYWSDNSSGGHTFKKIITDVVSDAAGAYSLPLIAGGTYGIALIPASGSNFANTVLTNVTVNADMSQNLVVSSKHILSGVVRSLNGTPVSNVVLGIKDQASGTAIATLTTDANGQYSVSLASGAYDMNVQYSGLASSVPTPKAYWIWPMVRNLQVSGATTRDLVLPFVTLSGHTTDTNGVPVPGVQVKVDQYWSDNSSGGYTFKKIITDAVSNAAGAYSLPLIAGGAYSVTIIPPAGSGFAQTVVNNLAVTQDILQNIILNYPDTIAPTIISGPTVSSITDTSAVIEWQTNEPTTGSVSYGLSSPPATAVAAATARTIHSVPLTGLAADTLYYVKVEATDIAGNGPTASSIVSFRTRPTPDTRKPVIIEGPVVTAITHDSAVVEWRTDEPSTGSVAYGLTSTPGQTLADTALATSHRVTLTGLNSATLHYVTVNATDAVGNGPTESPLLSFTTQAAPDTTAPVIVEGPLAVNIADTEATIVWKTDEPATSGISWNDGTAYGLVSDKGLVLDHGVRITGLLPATTYTVTVSTKDGLGNGPTLGKHFTFTTPAAADTLPPVVIEGPLVVNVTHQSAVIRWETDEPADSVIEYGTTADFGERASRAALVTSHNLPIVGLAEGTTYHFRVLSRDAGGNGPAASAVGTFTTDILPRNDKPVITKNPEVIHATDTTVTIAWETDRPTDSVVDYGAGDAKDKRSSNAKKEQKHQVTLTNLTPGNSYGYAIASTDMAGNTAVADSGRQTTQVAALSPFLVNAMMSDAIGVVISQSGFTTSATPDAAPPVITEGPTVMAVSETCAIIRWRTNEIADSRVSYGTGGELNLFAGKTRQGIEHLVVLTNLVPNTQYSYRVGSVDPSGNGPVQSDLLSFTTGATADSVPPIFTASPVATVVGDNQATIVWSTSEPTATQLRYGISEGDLGTSAAIPDMGIDHEITVTGLAPGTTYYVQAVATDIAGNVGQSSTFAFITTGVPVVTSHTLSVNFAGTGNGSVNSVPSGIACTSGPCLAQFTPGSSVTLSALPDDTTSVFTGWSGACTTASGDCTVTMDGHKLVTATFELMPPVRLVGTTKTYFSTLAEAYAGASTSGPVTLEAQDHEFVGDITLNKTIALTLKGGFNGGYISRPGYSRIRGVLTVGRGSLTVDGVVVK